MFTLMPGIEYTFSLRAFCSSEFKVSIAWCKELAAKIRTNHVFLLQFSLDFLGQNFVQNCVFMNNSRYFLSLASAHLIRKQE